ncbi:myosin-10-like [Phalaenopsis equestris]|uniref:myosin-10-like n=1 Tax=Phalaenopsis equestris TaxID=78828 RepID=UPI0009E2AD44|nr:myosin-10-like [Phalaenopsis equestris]XP_020593657.1 myosin-10-like [Phalaenopsis equestris]
MDMLQEVDDYIKESIECSLGLPVSEKTLRLKLLASEDERHRLQDQIFFLQDQLKESHKRLQLSKEETNMNLQGLKNCIQDKERMAARCVEMENYCAKMESECMLFERDLEKAMESCDELEKENNELRAQLRDSLSAQALVAEVKSLQEDKENLRINLQRAEEEVKVLFEDNRLLDDENKRLLRLLQRETQRHGSGNKLSASSSKGKRKSSMMKSIAFGRQIEFNSEEQARQPLTPF